MLPGAHCPLTAWHGAHCPLTAWHCHDAQVLTLSSLGSTPSELAPPSPPPPGARTQAELALATVAEARASSVDEGSALSRLSVAAGKGGCAGGGAGQEERRSSLDSVKSKVSGEV
jgi:hypothetical protein